MMDTQTLTLEKDGHWYLFRYTPGSEDALVEELMYLADDRTLNFDWMDAAALSFQVTQLAAEESLDEMEPDELTLD
jgi:hypothetical protein